MNEISATQLLSQMRQVAQQAGIQPSSEVSLGATNVGVEKPEFGDLLKNAVDSVNSASKTSGGLQDRFMAGDDTVQLSDVMIAGQKSRVTFETLLQTRNKMLDAYHEVMRMPI